MCLQYIRLYNTLHLFVPSIHTFVWHLTFVCVFNTYVCMTLYICVCLQYIGFHNTLYLFFLSWVFSCIFLNVRSGYGGEKSIALPESLGILSSIREGCRLLYTASLTKWRIFLHRVYPQNSEIKKRSYNCIAEFPKVDCFMVLNWVTSFFM